MKCGAQIADRNMSGNAFPRSQQAWILTYDMTDENKITL